MGGGVPYWADATITPLLPFNFIFLLIPNFLDAMDWFIGLHLIFLFSCLWFLAGALGLQLREKIFFSLWMFWSGMVWSCLILPHALLSQASLALVFGLANNFFKKPAVKLLVFLAFALVIPIFGGDPQFYVIGILILAVIWIFHRGSVAKFLTIILLSLGLAAPQLLPMFELAQGSVRVQERSLESAERASFSAKRLLDIVMPLPFGNRVPKDTFGAPDFLNAKEPFIFSFHLGGIVLVAAFLAGAFSLFRARRLEWDRWNASIFFLLVFFGGLAFGKNLPFYAWAFKFLPGWELFRYPERLMIPTLFCLCILVGAQLRQVKLVGIGGVLLMLFALGQSLWVAKELTWMQPAWIMDPASHPWRERLSGEKFFSKNGEIYKSKLSDLGQITETLSPSDAFKLDPVGKTIWTNFRFLHPNYFEILGISGADGITNFESIHWSNVQRANLAIEDRRILEGATTAIVNKGGAFTVEAIGNPLPYLYAPAQIDSGDLGALGGQKPWSTQSAFWKFATIKQERSTQIEIVSNKLALGKLTIKISGKLPKVLYWGESFDPHWEATLDGIPLELRRINEWATAVLLGDSPAETLDSPHVLSLNYSCWSIAFGCVVMFLSLGMCLFLIRSGCRFL